MSAHNSTRKVSEPVAGPGILRQNGNSANLLIGLFFLKLRKNAPISLNCEYKYDYRKTIGNTAFSSLKLKEVYKNLPSSISW